MAPILLALVQIPIPRVPAPCAIIPPIPRVPIVQTILSRVLGRRLDRKDAVFEGCLSQDAAIESIGASLVGRTCRPGVRLRKIQTQGIHHRRATVFPGRIHECAGLRIGFANR